MARLLTKVDQNGNVSFDVGRTLGGVIVGLVLAVLAYLLFSSGNANATAIWTLATAVISATFGLAVGEKVTGK